MMSLKPVFAINNCGVGIANIDFFKYLSIIIICCEHFGEHFTDLCSILVRHVKTRFSKSILVELLTLLFRLKLPLLVYRYTRSRV